MRSKNTEAKRVKALSHVILDQRSDVEQFFLEALEQIKEEIRKKIAMERKQRRVGNTIINNQTRQDESGYQQQNNNNT